MVLELHPIYPSIYVSIYLPIHPSIYPFIYLPVITGSTDATATCRRLVRV